MLRILVAMEAVGFERVDMVGDFQRAGSSWPSTGLMRTFSLMGFSMYFGNLSMVACGPFLPG